MRHALALAAVLALLAGTSMAAAQGSTAVDRTTVEMWIPAVGQREDGTFFGVASTLRVTMQQPGNGDVFLSTQPLTEIDMQGSARLAVETAAYVTGIDASGSDFFFSVTTSSVTIGGPSAGGAMAVAVAALLEGWEVREDIVMTGMVNPDGSIGPIGGLLQKLEAVASVNASHFLVPLGQSRVVVERVETVSGQQRVVRETVDVAQVGRDEYGIEVQEVADLYDAMGPFTGFSLVRPQPTTDPLAHEVYEGITARLAENLTAQVATRLDSVQGRYATVSGEAGAGERQTIEDQLALASARLGEARTAQDASKQYLASSLAFQGLVALSHAEAYVAFYEGNQPAAEYAATYLDATDDLVTEVQSDVRPEYPLAASGLDSQAGAEQRALDAEALQAQARAALQAGDVPAALQGASFARERAESARWWHRIAEEVGAAAPDPKVTEPMLEALWGRYRETADLELAYGALIASESLEYQAAAQAREDALAAAASGFVAAGLLELVEALAQTNTALVALAGDESVRLRLPDLSRAAAFQIELAQAQGSPAVYASALLELANSRAQDEPVGAYASYSTARIVARASLQAAGATPPTPGVAPYNPSGSDAGLAGILSPTVLALFLTLAIAAVILLIVGGAQLRSRPEPSAGPLAPAPPRESPPAPPVPGPPEWTPVPEPEPSPAPETAGIESPGVEPAPASVSLGPEPEVAEPAAAEEEPKPARKARPRRAPGARTKRRRTGAGRK